MKWIRPFEGIVPAEVYDGELDLWRRPDFLTPSEVSRTRPLPLIGDWREGPGMAELRKSARTAACGMSSGKRIGIALALAVFGSTAFYFLQTHGLLILMAGVVPFKLATQVLRNRGKLILAGPMDEALIDDPGDENEMLVEIGIFQNGEKTGADRGILALEGASLMFSGHRSTFCVGRSDVANRLLMSDDSDGSTTWWPIQLRHPEVALIVTLTPLRIPGDAPRKVRGNMEVLLKRFNTPGGKPPDGRQYPPLDRDPELLGIARGINDYTPSAL